MFLFLIDISFAETLEQQVLNCKIRGLSRMILPLVMGQNQKYRNETVLEQTFLIYFYLNFVLQVQFPGNMMIRWCKANKVFNTSHPVRLVQAGLADTYHNTIWTFLSRIHRNTSTSITSITINTSQTFIKQNSNSLLINNLLRIHRNNNVPCGAFRPKQNI